jgi:hypothetical protein
MYAAYTCKKIIIAVFKNLEAASKNVFLQKVPCSINSIALYQQPIVQQFFY